MSTSEIRCLKRYFECKSIHVSDYWLQCCLDWFKGEYSTYTEDAMCKSVYQQWLDSDLRDIEVGSLPINLSKEKKTVLNGKYAVQVLYVKDISRPAYVQLKNIRDMYKLTRGHIDSEDPVETSGKRVLSLFMTDGVQNICGFEYHTVPSLNLYITPGIKILLIGPLIVRNGEFMFKENNIQILGGEIEDLKVPNAAENILAKELNMPINPNPRTSDTNPNNTADNSTQASTYTPHMPSINTNNQINRNSTNIIETENNLNSNLNNVMSEFEDENFLANFDTSTFEEQEAAYQAQLNHQDADLDIDDDLFENLNFSETQNEVASKQNTVDDAALANITDLEELERQEFERMLQEEEENIDFNLEDDIDVLNKVIEQKTKPKQTLPTIDNQKPFTDIKYLLGTDKKLLNNKIYRVKAWFGKSIEKLKVTKNKGWTMTIEIKDESGKIIVDFLSDVIEILMELSPAEALAENRNVKNKNMESHKKLTESLDKCREKMSFEYIVDIKFTENKIATIVALETVKNEHLEQLKNPVESFS